MAATCQGNEINIQSLYLHHTCLGPNANQSSVVDGKLAANNCTVFDGPGTDAKLVARAQGLHIDAGNWHNSFSLVFENGRYSGSTLQVMGIVVERGEWAIIGGTGQFAMATGVIYKRFHVQNSDGNVMELTIKGFCPLLKSSPIDLGPSEIVKEISGTFGTFDGATVLRSFKLVTNTRTFGPWAEETGTPCRVPVQSGSGIVGFFARAGKYLDAIGVHVTQV
ncbi:hypothetical protein HU200_003244 [Digitaria exilis]|uniref:Dirigent protein n=1 Tax=Digitaria exilis TaxID=1010633 RepID=A0A835KVZ0_9POAL|nr:hypothetical protein HU200_003244 [Digitaria exilis]